ncbi:YfcL family protein [Paraglaciecola aquimarina]|uniref:YfcL family protein n=1 Tax=Paraglaciecola algarum TaxID=3050085 RepID=A0ABS9D7B2_9ALTE|nr:YfcL family protein [Paraglaciecola sp. G1-23]MCF2948574.1 YfcL family protein [Paraglaciecola sp. G1-23]
MTTSTKQSELIAFIDSVEQYLDKVVENGSDQQLFIASYLQGHFAVMAGQSQVQNMTKINQLDELMTNSLKQAFSNSELESEDQKQVWDLWQGFLA